MAKSLTYIPWLKIRDSEGGRGMQGAMEIHRRSVTMQWIDIKAHKISISFKTRLPIPTERMEYITIRMLQTQ